MLALLTHSHMLSNGWIILDFVLLDKLVSLTVEGHVNFHELVILYLEVLRILDDSILLQTRIPLTP